MHAFTVILLICLAVVASAAPKDLFGDHPPYPRPRPHPQHVKGAVAKVPADIPALELNLRKGEYVCGDKICRLRPGEVPKGCHGMCQYPLK